MYEMNTQAAREADTIDVMMKIMDDDDGPLLIRNFTRRRNAAEQFTMDHKADYGNTERSGDRVDTVHYHNQAVPRLHNTLSRKKSTVTITTLKANVMCDDFDPRCSACAQLAIFNELKKKDLKPKCNKVVVKTRSRSSDKTSSHMKRRSRGRSRERRRPSRNRPHGNRSNDKRYRDRLVGIDKTKSKTKRISSKSLYKMSKHWVKESCQFSQASVKGNDSKCTPVGVTSTHTTSPKPAAPAPAKESVLVIASKPNTPEKPPTPPSSVCTVSSFKSFLSYSHEPMDTNS